MTHPSYHLPNWPSLPHVGAVSIYDPNYNFFSGYHPKVTPIEFRRASKAIQQLLKQPITMNRLQLQNHNVCVPASPWGYIKPADACYTTTQQLACSISVADCIPILLAHRQKNWVAAVHAGWRGLYHNIIEHSLQNCPYPHEDIQAWLGPSICQKNYEVGPDLYTKFIKKNPDYQRYFQQHGTRYYPDLQAIACDQLHQLRVNRIYRDTSCTYSTPHLPSHRQNPKNANRFVACVWLKPST